MWQWAVLVLGVFLFGVAYASMRVYSREYRHHVMRFGRLRVGKGYGTSWTLADERGVRLSQVQWLLGPVVVVGLLLYFFTGLLDRGLVLYLGTTVGAGSLISLLITRSASFALAEKEVESVLSQSSRQDEQDK